MLKIHSIVMSFVVSLVIITTFYSFIGTAHGQTPYSAHGVSIVFPEGFSGPKETTSQGITGVSLFFGSPDVTDLLGPDQMDGGVMAIVFYPYPVTFQQILGPTPCQIQDWGNVTINSIVAQKVTVDCRFIDPFENSEQYLINGTILIKYAATDNFVYQEHYQAFINSLATFQLVNSTG